MKPEYKNVYHLLGLSYIKLRQWDNAIQAFLEELKYHPESYDNLIFLGKIYRELKIYPTALQYYKEVLTYSNIPEKDKIQKTIAAIEKVQKQTGKEEN